MAGSQGGLAQPVAGVADFRAFSGRQGVPIPTDAGSEAVLQRVLAGAAAQAKWGDVGAYSVSAVLDPEVRSAVQSFDRASALLGPGAGR